MKDANKNTEMERLREIERKQKERYRKQNEHTSKIYDRISFTVPKGSKELIEKKAKEMGMSVNAYISSLVMLNLDITNNNPIQSNREEDKEAQDIFDKYGKKYVLSGLGQKELSEKYGEETAKKVIDYAMRQS